MSHENDPMTATMKRHLDELSAKKKTLSELKKDIKNKPDERYVARKETGKEVKELEALICDEMEDGDEVMVGRRLFKKQRLDKTKYSKERIYDFCESRSIEPEVYDTENKEEKVSLTAVGKK